MLKQLVDPVQYLLRVEGMSELAGLVGLRLKRAFATDTSSREFDQRIGGYTFTAYSRETIQYLYKDVFLSNDYHFKSVNADPVILDCGANIGFSVLFFKRLYPRARIVAFEPNPHAFALLLKNIAQNHLDQVTPLNLGLALEEGPIDFYLSDDLDTARGSTRPERGGHTHITVNCTKLSKILAEHERVDAVKMDVEGSEFAIVQELHDSGAIRKPSRYLIEYHHKIDGERGRLSEFLRYFEDAGFDYNLKTVFGWSGAFQDVLIHAYKRD